MHRFLRGPGVHVLEAVLQGLERLGRHQIGLADENLVGKTDLATRLLAVIELLRRVFGVHQGQNGVEQKGLSHLVVHEKRLRHRAGIGQAGGFNHHPLKVEQPFAALGPQ